MALASAKKALKGNAVAGKATKPKPAAKASKPVAKKSNRPAANNSSDDDSGSDDEDAGDNQAAMLAMLEAQSRAMLGLPAETSAQGARRMSASSGSDESEDGLEGSDDENEEEYFTDDGWGAEDGFVTDSEDEFAGPSAPKAKKGKVVVKPTAKELAAAKPAAVPRAAVVEEVVFSESGARAASFVSKSEKRKFLTGTSASLMGLKHEDDGMYPEKKRARNEAEDAEDQSNLRLDKTLHDMLLTTLLPGAAADSASRPVDKRNALSGRLLELASYSLPGEGADIAKGNNMSQHPANVRTGLIHAQARRSEKARAEAEAAGSWVKGAGGLGDLGKKGAGLRPAQLRKREERTFASETGKKKGMSGTKNERAMGLGMGVGKFERGTLTISQGDITRINGREGETGGRGRGGRGRGGRGRGGRGGGGRGRGGRR